MPIPTELPISILPFVNFGANKSSRRRFMLLSISNKPSPPTAARRWADVASPIQPPK